MQSEKTILFLCWRCPWPARGGASLRTLGLIQQISKKHKLNLVILGQTSPTEQQYQHLHQYASEITWIPERANSLRDKISIVWRMLTHVLPYHPAILKYSLEHEPKIEEYIRLYSGIIITSNGHWGLLARRDTKDKWILNQCDADVDCWRVYASQTNSWITSVAAVVNWYFSSRFFPKVYERVGRIVSVCQEDRELTLEIAADTKVNVIENGIDCSYYSPNRVQQEKSRQILFTGTSAARNMVSLRSFVKDVLPLVRAEIADVKFLVAGNFSLQAQSEFSEYPYIEFTGFVDDIRPYFDQSDVYVSYFTESHGSKLKIAEAMSMAMPLVSTSAGCRGFPVVHEESILIGDSETEFAKHIVRLLKNKDFGAKLGTEARNIALNYIDWRYLGQRLNKFINCTNV